MSGYFKSLNNIETSFRFMRLLLIVVVVVSAIIVITVSMRSYTEVAKSREKIYVLDGGKSLILALQQDLTTNRPVELHSHVKMFHELFFTLSPDAEVIDTNLERAFALADRTAYNYYVDWNEAGYYRRIMQNNIVQRIVIDEVLSDVNHYPYRITVVARQFIQRESNITIRNLVTTMVVVDTPRSDSNPHGFMIQNFQVIRNDDIETQRTI
jgi:conjugative transposon TraK protein